MGDSASYLLTASSGWIPPDRSFVYGFILRAITVWPHSLQTVVWIQTALSAIACWLVTAILLQYFRAPVTIAAVCGIACALEPLQLISERYILTEAVSTFLFALFLLACFQFLRSESLIPLAAAQFLGVALISIRISFLPIVLLASLALPLFSVRGRSTTRKLFDSTSHHRLRMWARSCLVPLVFGLLLSQSLLFGYRHLYGSLIAPPMHGHPAYLYRDGLFLISDFAPLLRPEDYPIPASRRDVFKPSAVPLSDPKARDAQRWFRDGICDRIIRQFGGDEYQADRVAKKTALRALKRNGAGAVELAGTTAAQYFDPQYLEETIVIDEGRENHLKPTQIAAFQQAFGADFSHPDDLPFTKWWHRKWLVWYWFLLLLPELSLLHLLFHRRVADRYRCFSVLLLFIFLEGATLTVTRPTPRFLTAAAWLSFVVIGACLADLVAYRKARFLSPRC